MGTTEWDGSLDIKRYSVKEHVNDTQHVVMFRDCC